MKFTFIISLFLASTAVLAAPTKASDEASLVERATPATSIIAGIDNKVTALDTAIKAWNGGDYSKVKTASDDLIKTINSGTTSVNNGAALDNAAALALTAPIQDLTKKIETTVDDLIAKKAKVVAAGAVPVTQKSLNQQYTAAQALSKALTSKVPDALSDIAANLSAGITKAIQKGIDAYKGA